MAYTITPVLTKVMAFLLLQKKKHTILSSHLIHVMSVSHLQPLAALFVHLWKCQVVVHSYIPFSSSRSLAAQRRRVLAGAGEEAQRLPGGSVVSVVEDHGLLDGEEGDGPVPHVGAGGPRQQLALQSRPHLLGSVRALPLQTRDLTKPE